MVAGARVVAGAGTGALFAGAVAGLCCVTALDVAGLVAGLEAGCVVVSGSFGNGARVSDGKAFAADGISTLGEFVVTGPGGFSFFASGAISTGVFGDLFNAMAGAGIGLGSIDGATVSVFATSFDGATGAAAE